MHKSIKIVIGVLITIIVIWGIIFCIDYGKVSHFKMPIFVVQQENSNNITTYCGLGYKVKVERQSNINGEAIDGTVITKIEMYMFNKFITGAAANINDNSSQNNQSINVSNQFRAIVLSYNKKTLIVKPIEEKDVKILSDKVSIGLGDNNDMLYMEGQELLINYTGDIMDTYPTQIKTTKIQTEIDYKTKIEDLPQEYTLVNAIKDNCVISVHGNRIYNKDELDRFLENVNKNNADFIRCISYTPEGDIVITDVNFEGNNSFRVCLDSTRDKWSGKEDRTYKYGRFEKLNIDETEDSIGIYLTNPIEGELKEIGAFGYNKNAQIINNYEFNYLLNVDSTHKDLIKEITSNEKLSAIYDYDIYYYGFDNCKVQIDNKEIDLEQALIEKKVTMEQIIEQAEKDSKAEIIVSDMYRDGGTMIYFYDTYTIIKNHSIDGNRDVYIVIPEMMILNMER